MERIRKVRTINLDYIILVIMCLIYAFYAGSGAIYYYNRLLGLSRTELLTIPLFLCALWSFRTKYITVTRMHLWIVTLFVVYMINNPTSRAYFHIYSISLFIILMSLNISTEWFKIEINILKGIYIFYAVYTILMRIHPIFLQIAMLYFNKPTSMEQMLEQYSNGYMVGFTTTYSTNGMLLAVGTALFFSEYIYTRKIMDAIWSMMFTVALLLTGKRGHVIFSFIAIFIGYYVYESIDKATRRKKIMLVIMATIAFLIVIVLYVPSLSTFIMRFAETEEAGDITVGRTSVWLTEFDIIKNNPLFGIGWGQFINQGYWRYNAHNIYIQLLCETGIVGSAFYYAFFIYMYYKTYSLLKELREANVTSYETRLLLFSLCYQGFFLLYGVTGNPLYEFIMYVPYFFACSITLNSMHGRLKEM